MPCCFDRHQLRRRLGAVLVFGLIGCEDSGQSPSAVTSQALRTSGLMRVSSTGLLVSEQDMANVHARLIHDVAVALADPSLRTLVYEAMRQSPYREGQLHFRTFLEQNGSSLLRAIAGARTATETEVLRSLDSLMSLEFYMPVRQHRTAWTGDANVIVAGVLRDDGTIPTAFDLEGRPFPIVSADDPPPIPTLALVPAETDFSTPPTASTKVEQSSTTGIYMVWARATDDFEGFLMGPPEFEIHVLREVVDTPNDTLAYVTCAGEHRIGTSYGWDYNYDPSAEVDVPWTGEVLLATVAEIDTTQIVEIQWWEDDFEGCDNSGAGSPPDTDGATKAAIDTLPTIVVGIDTIFDDITGRQANADSVESVFAKLVNAVQDDDLVGVLSGPTQRCFEDGSGPMGHEALDKDGIARAYASIDFRYTVRKPICPSPPPPLPAGSVVITFGPSMVEPNTSCWYEGTASGGTPPYSLVWRKNGFTIGTGEGLLVETGTSSFQLELNATDANGRSGWDVLSVTVSPEAGPCVQ